MGQLEDLRRNRIARILNIQKGFCDNDTEDDIFKAHQVGDVHPSGKYVWTQLPNGKYDWRARKGQTNSNSSASAQKQDASKETDGNKNGERRTNNKQVKFSDKEKKEFEQLQDEVDKMGFESRLSPDKEKRYNELKKKKFVAHIDALNSDVVGKKQAHKNFIDYIEGNDGGKVDIAKIPNEEFKRITQTLEKKNPDHSDAERYLEEEAMSDKELKNFHAVAEHFKNSSKINKLTREYCRKWAELAEQEMQYRKKDKKK